jgi:hypothetical protein
MNEKYHRLKFDKPVVKNVSANFVRLFDVKHTNGTLKPNSIFGEDSGFIYQLVTRRGEKIIATSLEDMGKSFKGRVSLSFKYNVETNQRVRVKNNGAMHFIASVNFINQ